MNGVLGITYLIECHHPQVFKYEMGMFLYLSNSENHGRRWRVVHKKRKKKKGKTITQVKGDSIFRISIKIYTKKEEILNEALYIWQMKC